MKSIKDAHRVGRHIDGKHRTILVKLYSLRLRDDIIRACKSRGGKTREGYSILDDRTKNDSKIHARNVPIMQQWHDFDKTKVFYKHGVFKVKGVWYTEQEFQKLQIRNTH